MSGLLSAVAELPSQRSMPRSRPGRRGGRGGGVGGGLVGDLHPVRRRRVERPRGVVARADPEVPDRSVRAGGLGRLVDDLALAVRDARGGERGGVRVGRGLLRDAGRGVGLRGDVLRCLRRGDRGRGSSRGVDRLLVGDGLPVARGDRAVQGVDRRRVRVVRLDRRRGQNTDGVAVKPAGSVHVSWLPAALSPLSENTYEARTAPVTPSRRRAMLDFTRLARFMLTDSTSATGVVAPGATETRMVSVSVLADAAGRISATAFGSGTVTGPYRFGWFFGTPAAFRELSIHRFAGVARDPVGADTWVIVSPLDAARPAASRAASVAASASVLADPAATMAVSTSSEIPSTRTSKASDTSCMESAISAALSSSEAYASSSRRPGRRLTR